MKRLKNIFFGLAIVSGISGCDEPDDNVKKLPLKTYINISKKGIIYEANIYVTKPFFRTSSAFLEIKQKTAPEYYGKKRLFDDMQKYAYIDEKLKVKVTITPLKNTTKDSNYIFANHYSNEALKYLVKNGETISVVISSNSFFLYGFEAKGYYHIEVDNIEMVKLPKDTVIEFAIFQKTNLLK